MKTLKNKSQRTTLTRPLKKSELNQVANNLMDTHESTGTITLKEFVNKTGLPLQEAIDYLKGHRKGNFIEGRRGHPSRFVFGQALDRWVHQEEVRTQWRIRNGRDPLTGRLLERKGVRPYVHRQPIIRGHLVLSRQ